jgi:hypothetical protein
MTFGDFGPPGSVSAPPVSEVYIRAGRRGQAPSGEVYVPHPHGGTVGFGLKTTLSPSLRPAG